MKYISTRDISNEKEKAASVSAAHAIKQGLASDGGLFMPETIPVLSHGIIEKLKNMAYFERAAYILSMFLCGDFSFEELFSDCKSSYSEANFKGQCAPVISLAENIFSLELWHGPTCAFKDMALQIMPRLLSRSLWKTGEKRTALILAATSGDTGKAALEGYMNTDNVKIAVFYPEDGVSKIQKLQMTAQEGENVYVCAIRGNFDDAQNGVKKIFSDPEINGKLNEKNLFLSSANSINWGRLAPQTVYYISAYCDLLNAGKIREGEKINICVPTGNFGNIFAAYTAKKMGLPVNKLICASNRNNILTDFISSGIYDRRRSFHKTMSPSMDILISSNLERLLYMTAGAEKTSGYMKDLASLSHYAVDSDILGEIQNSFFGEWCGESETSAVIRNAFFSENYLCDTHTAVAFGCAEKYRKKTGDSDTKMLVVSTASPFKFASDVYCALTGEKPGDDISALYLLAEKTGLNIPLPLLKTLSLPVRFEKSVEPSRMAEVILDL